MVAFAALSCCFLLYFNVCSGGFVVVVELQEKYAAYIAALTESPTAVVTVEVHEDMPRQLYSI